MINLDSNRNLFITGGAGTGKSYLLNQYLSTLDTTKTAICASTGVAALLIGGITFHRFLGLQLFEGTVESLITKVNARRNAQIKKRYIETETIIIDEISMMDLETFVKASQVIANIRGNPDIPFGGIRIILVGDFFQLPPIKQFEDCTFLFQHPVWKLLDLEVINLTEPKRFTDEDPEFPIILDNVRWGKYTVRVKEFIESHLRQSEPHPSGICPTNFVSHNKVCDMENASKLKELTGKEYVFTAKFSSNISPPLVTKSDMLKGVLLPEEMILKVGAQVMLITNGVNPSLANGSRGIITDFSPTGYPIVEFMSGVNIEIKEHEFKVETRTNGNVLHRSKLLHIPLRLAWTTTSYKSQGASMDYITCDLSGCFAPCEIYVLLSRIRDPKYLYIKNFQPRAWRTCLPKQEVIDFYKNLIK